MVLKKHSPPARWVTSSACTSSHGRPTTSARFSRSSDTEFVIGDWLLVIQGHPQIHNSQITIHNSSGSRQRVEDHLERAEGLAAPLRTETKQHHAPVTVLHFQRSGLAAQVLFTEQVA